MLDLDMGRYAAFVWPAWGISVLVLGALIVRTIANARRWKRELAQLEAESGATPGAASSEERAQAAQRAIGQTKQ